MKAAVSDLIVKRSVFGILTSEARSSGHRLEQTLLSLFFSNPAVGNKRNTSNILMMFCFVFPLNYYDVLSYAPHGATDRLLYSLLSSVS